MDHQKQNPAEQGGVSYKSTKCGARSAISDGKKRFQVSRDEIFIFLPGISDAEYQQRVKLRIKRNGASLLIANTESETARTLAWYCADYVTALLYAAADNATLEEVNGFCRRLMTVAMQAEAIDSALGTGVI